MSSLRTLFRAALLASSAVSTACGAKVVLEESDETAPEPAQPEEPDPCAVHTTRHACCAARCRKFPTGTQPNTFVCISAERDCTRNPEVCRPDQRCDAKATSGNGGCDYGFTWDEVGVCVPR